MLLGLSSKCMNIHKQHVIDLDDDEIAKVEHETDDGYRIGKAYLFSRHNRPNVRYKN